MVAPGDCSPSRNVVSKITTRFLSVLVMVRVFLSCPNPSARNGHPLSGRAGCAALRGGLGEDGWRAQEAHSCASGMRYGPNMSCRISYPAIPERKVVWEKKTPPASGASCASSVQKYPGGLGAGPQERPLRQTPGCIDASCAALRGRDRSESGRTSLRLRCAPCPPPLHCHPRHWPQGHL